MRSTRSSRFPFLTVLLALLALAPAHVAGQEPTTTVILVRHAEKAVEPSHDPPLAPAGAARARALVEAAGQAGIQAIYTTQYTRTRDTAEPIAHELGIQVEVMPVSGELRAASLQFAERIRRNHAGQTVLVVGHSNTVPALIEALGAGSVGAIQDHEYDHLFIVQLHTAGKATLVHARYGERSVGS
jgi:broad specificity phosphatase PhoE